jgi:hypothetical protein
VVLSLVALILALPFFGESVKTSAGMGAAIGPRAFAEDVALAVVHHFGAPFQRRDGIQRREINKDRV